LSEIRASEAVGKLSRVVFLLNYLPHVLDVGVNVAIVIVRDSIESLSSFLFVVLFESSSWRLGQKQNERDEHGWKHPLP
jgi:hypothetical protein